MSTISQQLDHQGGRGTAQQCLNELLQMAGTGFAAKKRLVMSHQNVFLGQVNDFSGMMSNGYVMVRPKPGRDLVIRGYVSEARASGRLTPATSGKLRGLVQFYGSSIHGQIAKGGLQPLAERQYSQESNLTDTLDKALQYIDVMTHLAPHRRVPLVHNRERVTVRSDAE